MGLKGKLVSQVSVKWDGDLFHLFQCPYQFSEITPHLIESVDLLAGSWGASGSMILWTYNQDGVKSVSKEIIENVVMNEKKKSLTYRVIEGDPLKFYDAMKIIVDVEGHGKEKMVTWTIDYEKKNGSVPEPTAFMDYIIDFTKDVERSRLLVPN